MTPDDIILASASPRRLDLLAQIGIAPGAVQPADIDETPYPAELPREYARRVSAEKADAVAGLHPEKLVLAADTVVACGRRILPKAEDERTAAQCLTLISGRSHRVYTAACLAGPKSQVRTRITETRVKVARLSTAEIRTYLDSGEWRGKAGGYAIQGRFAAHIVSLIGSYTNVVGLPLHETANLLRGAGVIW